MLLKNKFLKKTREMVGVIACILAFNACSDYLDIVPDGDLATLDKVFEARLSTKQYLYTCYSYMANSTREGSTFDPGIKGGDEWGSKHPYYYGEEIARGLQNATNPYANDWEDMYKGLRTCNIFLENIDKVTDMTAKEKEEWTGEVLTLKAFFHFRLVRKWGPIPIVRENVPVYASLKDMHTSRDPVDECFDYILELLTEAIPKLPLTLANPVDEKGRVDKSVAAALKARVAVFAASPLFCNNDEMKTLVNKDGTRLFKDESAEKVNARWNAAVVACREAIQICHDADFRLNKFETVAVLSDTIKTELTLRTTFTEKWNSEIIWANTQTNTYDTGYFMMFGWPNFDYEKFPGSNHPITLQVSKKIADQFYTNHGLPIEDDKSWQGLDPLALRKGDESHSYYIKRDYTTVQLHFDREPRFYATLGFDGGLWYGQRNDGIRNGNNPDNYFYIRCRYGDTEGRKSNRPEEGPYTGYFPKKFVHYENVQVGMDNDSYVWFSWPLLRLSDLFLLYSEAINEAEGPNGPNSADLFAYIDSVRAKSKLPKVKDAWDNYAINRKYQTKEGMRQIIQRERMIEIALEGERFWDIRRWKIASTEYAKGIYGWNLLESDPEKFYQPTLLYDQPFSERDYFWPIKLSLIDQNPDLVQNIGW